MSVKPKYFGTYVFDEFNDSSYAVLCKLSPPNRKEKYIRLDSKINGAEAKVWLFIPSLIKTFSGTVKGREFLASKFLGVLPASAITSGIGKEKLNSSSGAADFESKERVSLSQMSSEDVTMDSDFSTGITSSSNDSVPSSTDPIFMEQSSSQSTCILDEELLETIELCTEDRTVDMREVEKLRAAALKYFEEDGKTVSKSESKDLHIARSILHDPSSQKSYLLMTHHKKKKDKLLGKGKTKKAKFAVVLQTAEQRVVTIFRGKDEQLSPNSSSEVELMKRFKGKPHIVQWEFACVDGNRIYCILEYCNRGTLFGNIKEKKLSDVEKLQISRDLLEGLKILHEEGVYHRDFKPENILLTEKGGKLGVRIADFGFACDKLDTESLDYFGCSPIYTAPEKCKIFSDMKEIKRDKRFSALALDKLDVWALGITFFEMFQENYACFQHMTSPKKESVMDFFIQGANVSQNNIDIQIQAAQFDRRLKPLLRRMLRVNPDERITVFEALEMHKKTVEKILTQQNKPRGCCVIS